MTYRCLCALFFASLALVACGQPDTADQSGAAHTLQATETLQHTRTAGLFLPTPKPLTGFSMDIDEPPAAWLIYGRRATTATYGSFCTTMCVDFEIDPQQADMATVEVPRTQPMTVRIATPTIRQFQATVLICQDHFTCGAGLHQQVSAQANEQDGAIVYTLDPVESSTPYLLHVFVYLSNGDASYYWKIHPTS